MSVNSVGSVVGLIREATIKEVDFRRGIVRIIIGGSKSDVVSNVAEIAIPGSWMGPNGEFAGGCPVPGASIYVSLKQGGQWAALSYIPNTNSFGNKSNISLSGFSLNTMSAFRPGRHLIQVKNNIRHITDPIDGVEFGDPVQFVQADPKLGILSNTFNNNMAFTEANREVTGSVFRDLNSNSVRNISGSALTSHEYQKSLYEIGLDPRTKTSDAFTRNPAFAENREIVYEFKNSFGFTDDNTEIRIYDQEEIPTVLPFFPRRDSRADTLSLSLITPNQLIETTKGTVVDIYGNLVDLNRFTLPNGTIDSLSFRNVEVNSSDTFRKLREQTRKSLAYHFEINARKADIPDLNSIGTYVNDTTDYARNRSRFFFDVDKEGQFKLNVPSSSEVGNVALLARYENYSTLIAAQDDSDPRQFVRSSNNQDIFLDAFGTGVISLTGGDETLEGFAAPVDRLNTALDGKEEPIKLGTTFHALNQTLYLHAVTVPIPQYPQSKLNLVPPVTQITSPEVIVSGPEANAGGRSGTISLDGMASISIGANTVDRQSLWLDLAGGMVSNIGRDRQDNSYVGRMDGNVLLQIGGNTPDADSRFSDLNNGYINGVFDMRIFVNGAMHIMRFDETGIRIFTPGEIDFVADGAVRLMSRRNNLYLHGERIFMYSSDGPRLVERIPGKSIK